MIMTRKLPPKFKYKSYEVWRSMIARCRNKNNHAFKHYGGRGIKVCERWMMFENFIQDMGDKPTGYTLGRIDNDGGYEKSNCHWETMRQQTRNYRRNVKFTIYGETKCLTDWAESYGIDVKLVNGRIGHGWSVEAALTHPKSIHHTRHGVDFDRTKPWDHIHNRTQQRSLKRLLVRQSI